MQAANTWAWSSHACRHCGSRIVCRTDGPSGAADPIFECGGCSVQSRKGPEQICGCGILPASSRPGPRFRCVPNPNRGVASPNAIVIEFSEAPAVAGTPTGAARS